MSDYEKPLPDLDDPLTAPHFKAANDGRLVVQRCARCGYLRWPPTRACPECLDRRADWFDVEPVGTLWSVAIYCRALDPAFAGDVPYGIGLIQLRAGPRMYGRLSGDRETWLIDNEMEAVFEPISDDVSYVFWRSA